MASFDIKSELNIHELTNAVDQANRILKSRFDFKGTGAEFTLSDKQINLLTKEDFQIKQITLSCISTLHELVYNKNNNIIKIYFNNGITPQQPASVTTDAGGVLLSVVRGWGARPYWS